METNVKKMKKEKRGNNWIIMRNNRTNSSLMKKKKINKWKRNKLLKEQQLDFDLGSWK